MAVGGTVEEVCRLQEVIFDWKVENFTYLPYAIDYKHCSPDFHFLGRSWYLELFPNGEKELLSEGYVGLYLCLSRPDPPFEVRFSLGIRPVKGETKVGYENTSRFEEKRYRWGSHKSIKRSILLQRRELLPLDFLTIRVALKAELPAAELAQSRDIVDPQPASAVESNSPSIQFEDKCTQASSDVPPDLESLSRDLRRLLELEIFPDVTLRCGNRDIPAHMCILSARSQVFTALFLKKMEDSETGPVTITDTNPEVLDLLLQYVYSGKISNLSEDTVSSLYEAGDVYSVHSLKSTCSDWMVGSLTPDNSLRFMKLAEAHGDEDLKERVVHFVAENLESLKREAWSEINKDHPGLALSVYQRRLEPALSKQA